MKFKVGQILRMKADSAFNPILKNNEIVELVRIEKNKTFSHKFSHQVKLLDGSAMNLSVWTDPEHLEELSLEEIETYKLLES
jgi:hypothetical protein